MTTPELLEDFKAAVLGICAQACPNAKVLTADTPAVAQALLSNALSAAPMLCLFISSDTAAGEVFGDPHSIARVTLAILQCRVLDNPTEGGAFSILTLAHQLRVRLAETAFSKWLVPMPRFVSMEYIKESSGRFYNGYLLNFDCHYTFN